MPLICTCECQCIDVFTFLRSVAVVKEITTDTPSLRPINIINNATDNIGKLAQNVELCVRVFLCA